MTKCKCKCILFNFYFLLLFYFIKFPIVPEGGTPKNNLKIPQITQILHTVFVNSQSCLMVLSEVVINNALKCNSKYLNTSSMMSMILFIYFNYSFLYMFFEEESLKNKM